MYLPKHATWSLFMVRAACKAEVKLQVRFYDCCYRAGRM